MEYSGTWSWNLSFEVKYLDKVSILDALLAEEKKQVANALVEMHFASADRIIQQGEPGNMFLGFSRFRAEVPLCGLASIQPRSPGWMPTCTLRFYIMYEGDVDIDKDGEVATGLMGWQKWWSKSAMCRCQRLMYHLPDVGHDFMAVLLGLTRVSFLLPNAVEVAFVLWE